MNVGRRRAARFTDYFGLERNVVAVGSAMFLLGLGENLWKSFLPNYLQALGAPVVAIGLYGTLKDFLDGAYQYPGGWIADRYGRRRALLLFVGLASVGYLVYALAPSWPFVLVGLVFSMAWVSMASPTLFAVVGDALPRERRAIGFTAQAILKRLPIVVAPTLGGLAIAAYGVRTGVRLGLAVTVALALATFTVVARVRIPLVGEEIPTRIGGVWRSLPGPLKWLLFSDIFIRPDVRGLGRRLSRPVRADRRGSERASLRRAHRRSDGDGEPGLRSRFETRRPRRKEALRHHDLPLFRGLPRRRRALAELSGARRRVRGRGPSRSRRARSKSHDRGSRAPRHPGAVDRPLLPRPQLRHRPGGIRGRAPLEDRAVRAVSGRRSGRPGGHSTLCADGGGALRGVISGARLASNWSGGRASENSTSNAIRTKAPFSPATSCRLFTLCSSRQTLSRFLLWFLVATFLWPGG